MTGDFGYELERTLRLKRRRSRVPWIYAVYHAPEEIPGGGPEVEEVKTASRGTSTIGSDEAPEVARAPDPLAALSYPSDCRLRKAGTSSGDTGSNSAPGVAGSPPLAALAPEAGISSTDRRESDIRAVPEAAGLSPDSCFHEA